MATVGYVQTYAVATGSFTTVATGAMALPNKGHLKNVSVIANAQSTPPFDVVIYAKIGNAILRLGHATVRGDPDYDQGTGGWQWFGDLSLDTPQVGTNQLQFIINNDSGSTIVAAAGATVEA